MRTFKFRAWNGESMNYSIMVGRFGAFWVSPGKLDNGLDPSDGACLSPFNTKCTDHTIIMQFTGLLDKTGKGIYEGDILKWKCSKSGHSNNANYTVTIHWPIINHGHGYELTIHHKGEKWATGNSYWNAKDREVIGNIFENPELLKPSI